MQGLNKWWASLELILATALWGFGFTATTWALESMDSITMSLVRFMLAFILGLPILFSASRKHHLNLSQFKLSAIPGLMLGAMIILQTWGLQHTSVTNSGFITTLYVVIVPIIEAFFLKQRMTLKHYFWVFLALLGTAMMVNLHVGSFNLGDILTLLCASMAAIQIVWVGFISHKITSSYAFNIYQCFWAGLSSVLFWPIYPQTYFHIPNALALWGLVSLILGSTIIGFGLQIKAQRVLSPSVSSLIFLLESPFAACFAMLILGEKMGPFQIAGGIIIVLSALGSVKTSIAKH